MIKVALFGVVVAIVLGAAAVLVDRFASTAEPPLKAVVTRFPEGWASAPVVEYRKPLRWLSAVSQISPEEFEAAVVALERLRPLPRPPQPADAVFNDAQIASMKERLNLTEDQEAYWQEVELALREVVWDRRRSNGATLEPTSLERFKEAAAPFVATLNTRQKSEIRALANIVGLRIDLSGAQ